MTLSESPTIKRLLRTMIGRNVSDYVQDMGATRKLFGIGADVRFVWEDGLMTADFRPDRITVIHDRDGTIKDAYIG